MFFVEEPILTLLPELKYCSNELLLSGINHTLVYEVVNTVLHYYAQLAGSTHIACEIFIIYGSYNFI